jgi:nucleoside 2-deoxyribosyltransferase
VVNTALTAYLAGPDVFLPDAQAHALRKIEVCARHGIVGRTPLNQDIKQAEGMSDAAFAMAIFHKDIAMMEACDIVIANLTPFRGASADSGTLVELGWFLGRGRPIFGYSNSFVPFAERSRMQIDAVPDPHPGVVVNGFDLHDNLMIPCAVLHSGGHEMVVPSDGKDRAFDALDVFERCVAIAARSVARPERR